MKHVITWTLYVFLYNGILELLGSLGERDRLDGFKWYQSPLTMKQTGWKSVWYNVWKSWDTTKREINGIYLWPRFYVPGGWWITWRLGRSKSWQLVSAADRFAKKILKRMRECGIEPVLPGYSGMVPTMPKKAGTECFPTRAYGAVIAVRLSFSLPIPLSGDSLLLQRDGEIVWQSQLLQHGTPVPWRSGVAGVDSYECCWQSNHVCHEEGKLKAVWVAQAWQPILAQRWLRIWKPKDMIVSDLFAESRPQWGDWVDLVP